MSWTGRICICQSFLTLLKGRRLRSASVRNVKKDLPGAMEKTGAKWRLAASMSKSALNMSTTLSVRKVLRIISSSFRSMCAGPNKTVLALGLAADLQREPSLLMRWISPPLIRLKTASCLRGSSRHSDLRCLILIWTLTMSVVLRLLSTFVSSMAPSASATLLRTLPLRQSRP